jgi:very-short-patch-repair endonuclease
MTDAERALWHLLRDRRLAGFKFRRQSPFKNYVLDFVCFDRKLVVELDGGQHSGSRSDQIRDAVLAADGFMVVRYWNNDVLRNAEGVLVDLLSRLRSLTPHPAPAPAVARTGATLSHRGRG